MLKNLFACALILLGTAASAQTITCTAHSKLVGKNAAGGSSRDRARIVDSWIPSSFVLTQDELSYEGWNPIPLSSRSDAQASAHMNTEMRDSKGRKRKMSVRYDVTLKPEDGQAVVYMRSKGYKTMGPVVFNCDY